MAATAAAARVSYMTPEQVRADRAGRPNAEVYDWEVTRLETPVTMEAVGALVGRVRAAYVAAREAHPGDSDAQIQERLMAAAPDVRTFGAPPEAGGTHHVLFLKLTNRHTPPAHLKLCMDMIRLRAKHERDNLGTDAHTAEVSQFFGTRVKEVTRKWPVKEPALFYKEEGEHE
jgi:hypothetical protein